MTDQPEVTYYAILSDAGVPTGLVRRTHLPVGTEDESFRRDLTWRPTEFLYKYWLGHNDIDYKEISAEEALSLADSWRQEWAREDGVET
ncbi:hypothetical protein [Mycolicibacterium sphagni]|uniref:Uncharacterized protein n=1 Tax=Mycolicibacterium sphagni TaxID=1786 RepID=A0ABX2JYG6_9MYCO|nr:hypothetical protein [Mycolicibacterium sphagni]NTY59863.1 hypothetical protein [Mycolicibacterium sphagni]